jgi:hypothetical protein
MSHTRHLSLLEDLAYRRLLDFYFLHEQPIKHRDAARQIGMREHEEDVLTVLNEFFLSTDDGFVEPTRKFKNTRLIRVLLLMVLSSGTTKVLNLLFKKMFIFNTLRMAH